MKLNLGYYHTILANFRQNRLAYYSTWVIAFLVVIALIADFIAYNKPYYAKYQGKIYFPIVYDYLSAIGLYDWDVELKNQPWSKLKLESSIWPPVRYLPSDIDIRNAPAVSPLAIQDLDEPAARHYLGTDLLGRDVLSGMIHGTRISLTVGLVSVGISAIIGILLGAFAGYYGDERLQASRASIILGTIGIFLGFYYAFYLRSYTFSDALADNFWLFFLHFLISCLLFAFILFLCLTIAKTLQKIPWFSVKQFIWIDILISRIIEVKVSIPTMLLIISIAAIAKPSLFLVMVIIGLTSWTGIARFTRGELLKIRNLDYIQAAQALGYSDARIIFRHAIPNALAPVFVSVAFGIASAILAESSLSFLGIG
ncbi:MAG: ABC transporter permease subunit, partial [Bacteroidia bacterium]|nr:ABC transporter permease subunit [Bacteroidia bacterium]